MKNRIHTIITKLYTQPTSKNDFMEILGVSQKTVETTIKQYNEDINIKKNIHVDEIVYDRKLGKYRFGVLLPTNIPYSIFLSYMKDNINDTILNDDFEDIIYNLELTKELSIPLIPTYHLSQLLKNIIKVKLAFVLNAVLEIEYIGLKQKLETKYIRPHCLVNTGYTHYLYASYDKKNDISIGEQRTFSLKGIKSIKLQELVAETLYKEIKGNAWGEYDKSLILQMRGNAASFFKREKITNTEKFEFVSEEHDNSILIKMLYRKEEDIVQLIQQWMPHISIHKHSEVSDRIYQKIKENYVDLTIQRELSN